VQHNELRSRILAPLVSVSHSHLHIFNI